MTPFCCVCEHPLPYFLNVFFPSGQVATAYSFCLQFWCKKVHFVFISRGYKFVTTNKNFAYKHLRSGKLSSSSLEYQFISFFIFFIRYIRNILTWGIKTELNKELEKVKNEDFLVIKIVEKQLSKHQQLILPSASGAHTATTQLNTSGTSRSASKVETILQKLLINLRKHFLHIELLTLEIIVNFVSMLCCPECYADRTLSLNENHKEKKGFASYLVCPCSNCSYEYTFYTSNP